MRELDFLYAEILGAGFIVLRAALNSKDWEWINAEYEVLHNVPSLIGEANIEHHKCYWFGDRTYYLDWLSAKGPEGAQSRMPAYYKPIWDKMELVIMQIVSGSGEKQ